MTQKVALLCPCCQHKWEVECPELDDKILLEDDVCPNCGCQGELDNSLRE